MSVQERGVIEGVDIYNLDSERLLAIPQRSGDPPPDGGCANALSLVKNR
jgi:hypothetical protein